MTKYASKAHKAVARAIGYALTVGESFDAWSDFSAILSLRLTIRERAMLARAVLRSLPDDVLDLVLDSLNPAPEPVDPRITEAAIEYRRQQGLASFAEVRA
ncbi:hypothetical protein [Mangrovicoccus sp. HB161399]|uniref:hypothetical protein n=1 Tax=Mangrovicoccus sp. HB161399 TaxID=2720392 RepID=UPI0015543FD7|nr:hypothetical protein [Mangrovicoccus sp. HB161399]